MRARDRARERRLLAMQTREESGLARLEQYAATRPYKPGSQKASALASGIKGLAWRVTDRQVVLARLETSRVAQDAAATGIRAALAGLAPWRGTAADLLRLEPGAAASPAALGILLRRLAPALLDDGIHLEFRREAGTGRRLVAAEWVDPGPHPPLPPEAVTIQRNALCAPAG